MRNIKEQASIVSKRANELKKAKKRRNCYILSLSSIVVCLLLIMGTALAMPGVTARLSVPEHTNVIGFAGIFSSGDAMGYLLMALLGFMLGICLTILCVYLHKRSKEDKNNDRDS
ncbi:MAG: DUF4179 domain-containing protein [Lachnospiraceae bacterium]